MENEHIAATEEVFGKAEVVEEKSLAQIFSETFKTRTDDYALQAADGNYHRQGRRLTEKDIQEHLRGKKSIGTYIIDNVANIVHLGVIDFDRNSETEVPRQRHQVQSVFLTAEELGLAQSCLLEDSGNKGYHLWLVSGGVEPRKMRALLSFLIEKSGTEFTDGANFEIFPKQDHVKEDGFGNLIKLPLGIHQKSQRRSRFIDTTFEMLHPVEAMTSVSKLLAERVDRILREHQISLEPRRVERATDDNTQGHRNPFPCINNILGGVSEGERNEAAFALTKWMFKQGMSEPLVYSAVETWNRSLAAPLDTRELETVVRSVATGGYTSIGCESPVLSRRCASPCPLKKDQAKQERAEISVVDVSHIHELEIPETSYVLKPFLPEQGKIIISGRSGSFKTFLTVQLALRISLGRTFLLAYPTTKVPVLYVEGETSLPAMVTRLRKVVGNTSLPEQQFYFWPARGLNLADKKGLQTLKDQIQRTQAKCVILDPISRFWTGEENSNQQVNGFLSGLNTLIDDCGTSLILAHHHAKPITDRPNQIRESRGASAWMDWADSEIGLIKRQKYNQTLIEVNFLKVRHAPAPEPLSLSFDSAKFDFITLDEGATATNLVYKVLVEDLGGTATRQGIIKALEEFSTSERSVATALAKLKKEGKIDSRQTGIGREVEYFVISRI